MDAESIRAPATLGKGAEARKLLKLTTLASGFPETVQPFSSLLASVA
jgi:hypothetical protein